ncbi:Rha family transcriptional regulator [Fulvimarina sp. 2208YS6-2-32]|uniref:Rha family transcriptional regulator n=1 Tax=Fulvimarina uroteuthidis TaxID=3098149 RepID=A0ABU5I0F9_9HYPH|nr:Rha family transcriptional regulator [Fulvimarina sp. 2208YS6-2-32]MDY8108294.1 Rha family transcriptional regulator [Fulvimarina sp. 2208YS6-2-32]
MELALPTPAAPVVFVKNGSTFANSRDVAKTFEKQHSHVLRAYDRLECSAEFNRSNYGLVDYRDEKGELRRSIDMTRDGFVFIVFGFTGSRAAKFKEDYIAEFNRMEAELREGAKPALSVNQQLRIVAEARKTLGVEAAARVWADVGLPMPASEERFAPDADVADDDKDAARVYAAIARTGSATYREVYRRCKPLDAHRLRIVLDELQQAGRIVCETKGRGAGWPLRTYHPVKPNGKRIAAPNEADRIDQMIFKATRVSGGASKTAIYRVARQRGWSNETLMDRINSLVRDGLLRVSYFHHGPSGGRPLTIYHASAQ